MSAKATSTKKTSADDPVTGTAATAAAQPAAAASGLGSLSRFLPLIAVVLLIVLVSRSFFYKK